MDLSTRSPRLHQALVLAAGVVVGWSAVRVVRMLTSSGFDPGDGDPHGYAAVFSLVLVPLLVAAAVWLVRDAVWLWRRAAPLRVGTGVLVMVSSPIAGPYALVGLAVGGAIVVAGLVRRPS